jgi:hypothetical protein
MKSVLKRRSSDAIDDDSVLGRSRSYGVKHEASQKFEGDDYVFDLYSSLRALQQRLKSFQSGNELHDRRDRYNGFFMPLSFNNDIRFHPIDSQSWTESNLHDDTITNEDVPLSGSFDDIDKQLEKKRQRFQVERQRQRHMLHTKDDIFNWTPVGMYV